ncbi:hypothetical protein LZQ00_05630 [Sphingobacterium sp. SRCM116780]|uniref:hypothetical protein n=1 Tax=Sphingobacterium sp. SRCM116780 TaxID=2907623 RepID=UPI001F34B6A1|nr:hypothetical protein [Sphingobacterium sp. SRCM116780]UIR57295.1 hypothetical protein LZQ00_05630 [Sphingobacterium sp. SRCM116780]
MKFLYSITFLSILLLSSCNQNKVNQKTEKIENNKISFQPKIDTATKEIPLFKAIETRTLPFTDSTNFDNFLGKDSMPDEVISQLHLGDIEPQKEAYFLRYKFPLSTNFESIVVTIQSEMEMSTYVINYSSDFKIIDKLKIAYDEIAESAFCTVSHITTKDIVCDEYNYMEEVPKKETFHYAIDKTGKFIAK